MVADTLLASAKVNLTLRILGKDNEGYHNLQSLVAFANFGDELHIEVSITDDEIIWKVGLQWVGEAPSDNILWHVLAEIRKVIELPYLRIMLVKRIPMGGGLGGGSTDAACLLRYCMEHYNLPYGEAVRIAKKLGSDIVVCLGGRVSWMGGRGNDLLEVVGEGNFPQVHCLLVGGGGGEEGLSTGDVFAEFSGDYSQGCDVVDNFNSYDDLLNFLNEYGGNDLFNSAVNLCDGLLSVRDKLLEVADYVGMSGSGSVMFGLFRDEEACNKIKIEGYETVTCRLGHVEI